MRRASCPGAGARAFGPTATIALVLCGAVALGVAGCGTGGLAVKRDVWEAEENFSQGQAKLSEKVLYLEGRVSALEEENSALKYQLEQAQNALAGLDTDFSRGLEAVRTGQEQLGIELEGRIRSVDTGRQEDRDDLLTRMQIILDEVTKENARLREDVEALRTSVASMATGYTHEVKRGETLAGIAQQYGVSVAAIAEANGITNPNLISVGKVLTIPAR
jgi:colicin import membrane protein